MGSFIISRTAVGDRFILQSDAGRTLAVSRDYANLDACKKGICSLVYYAPIVPIVDRSAGEYGPNPKFEITADDKGALYYAIKSANGKSVVTAGPFATKKACLRAIAMLRAGVVNADVFFARPAGFERLTVGNMVRDGMQNHTYDTLTPPVEAQTAPAGIEEAPAVAEAPAVEAEKPSAPAVKVPHRIRTDTSPKPSDPPRTAPAKKPSAKPAVSKSLFSRLFKKQS